MYSAPGINYYGTISESLVKAYETINKPQYMWNDLPGRKLVILHGPIDHHITEGMQAHFAKHFGESGLSVEYSPAHDPQHFTARFSGAAYEKLMAAQTAYEAKYPNAIGH